LDQVIQKMAKAQCKQHCHRQFFSFVAYISVARTIARTIARSITGSIHRVPASRLLPFAPALIWIPHTQRSRLQWLSLQS
jgi:hypothetical protein